MHGGHKELRPGGGGARGLKGWLAVGLGALAGLGGWEGGRVGGWVGGWGFVVAWLRGCVVAWLRGCVVAWLRGGDLSLWLGVVAGGWGRGGGVGQRLPKLVHGAGTLSTH